MSLKNAIDHGAHGESQKRVDRASRKCCEKIIALAARCHALPFPVRPVVKNRFYA